MPNKTSSAVKSKILWIEGSWGSNPNFVSLLRKKGFTIQTVSTGKAALNLVGKDPYNLVVINAASMRTSGKRICKSIRDQKRKIPIIIICSADKEVEKKEACANTVMVLPFTTRKLVNRIEPLLPGDEAQMVKVGPITYDTNRNQITCHGKKTTLTPRLVRLFDLLLENKGDVVEREALFKHVWRTNYTGDTRTLDVHVSWLRQAIEKDPRNPKILVTIRGVGYRLDV